MKFLLYLVYFVRSVRLRGLLNTVKLLSAEIHYERKFRIRTAAIKASDSADYFHYQGASYLVLLRIFRRLANYTATHRFTDIGSGKGRAVLVAEFCGFSDLLGIERDAALVEESRQNAKRYPYLRPDSTIRFEVGNALTYPYPSAPVVYFMFNPFSAEVLREVLGRLTAVQSNGTLVVYMNPLYQAVFDDAGWVPAGELRTNNYLEAVFYHPPQKR